MNTFVKITTLSALTLSSMNTFAVSDTFDATLEVKQAITMTRTSNLDFGIITSDRTADVVIAQGDAGAATFNIDGGAGEVVDVAIAGTNLVNGANNVAATFDFSPTLTLTGGTAELKIGGTAQVSTATLVAGTYSASVPVDVTYQ